MSSFIVCVQVELRAHTFYELTDGCELTLADVKCQYFVGQPPDTSVPGDNEQTQAYFFEATEEADGGQQASAVETSTSPLS